MLWLVCTIKMEIDTGYANDCKRSDVLWETVPSTWSTQFCSFRPFGAFFPVPKSNHPNRWTLVVRDCSTAGDWWKSRLITIKTNKHINNKDSCPLLWNQLVGWCILLATWGYPSISVLKCAIPSHPIPTKLINTPRGQWVGYSFIFSMFGGLDFFVRDIPCNWWMLVDVLLD